ncbi:S9 family peptidase [Methylonatrum kenyense]|uniref:S9 family peptidase n=1 Tax=Methylonatrum kenyense TaxID=455253 RepID=UPI0020C0E1CC|nr:S9 family peptidase [Methylonatrum kenyense]MCK8516215.1 S9 family peptidase [Methylonatrum kenyense]
MTEQNDAALAEPVADVRPKSLEWHGHRREDPYAWLRDANWREAMRDAQQLEPAIRAYLGAENAWAEQALAPVAGLQRALVDELRGRIREDDSSVPQRDGDFYYYSRFREGGQHALICRRQGEDGQEQILLDGDSESEGLDYFHLGAVSHSQDHRYLAYAVDRSGAEIHEIRVRDLETGQDLPDRISGVHGDFDWAANGRTLFYTTLDEEHRPREVRRHRLGTEQAADPLVYREPDPGFFLGVGLCASERFLLIESHDHTTSETRVIPADQPEAEPRVLAARERDVEYEVEEHDGRWLIRTNADGAEDFCIMQAPLSASGRGQWRVVVPHRPGCLIRNLLVYRDWLVRLELEDSEPRIVVRRVSDGQEHRIAFDEPCFSLGVIPGLEYVTDNLRFSYSSLTTPTQVFDYDMASRSRVLRKQQEIPSGHDPSRYVAKRLHALAPDGAEVPISLFHRADLEPDGDTPLLLYGYGAYGISSLPAFSPHRLSLVDRGFVYAIAHVRGGLERGYRWYRQGRLQDKPNTFSDFIACAEHLTQTGYTGVGRISMHGGSAGGMLVGAVLNQRPDLFRAAVADVPFVDVLNTMLDPELPLTPPEWPEWGNPIEDPEAYRTILSYSPYDNVTARDYPHLLVTAGVSDPRVTYWEPAKWVARLRALRTNDNLLLLQTNMSAGHGGASGRFDYLEEVARRYAFLLLANDMADS